MEIIHIIVQKIHIIVQDQDGQNNNRNRWSWLFQWKEEHKNKEDNDMYSIGQRWDGLAHIFVYLNEQITQLMTRVCCKIDNLKMETIKGETNMYFGHRMVQ